MWKTLHNRVLRSPEVDDPTGGGDETATLDAGQTDTPEAGADDSAAQPGGEEDGTSDEPVHTNAFFEDLKDRVHADNSVMDSLSDETVDAYTDWVSGNKEFPDGDSETSTDEPEVSETKTDDEPEVDASLAKLMEITGTKDMESAAKAVQELRNTLTGKQSDSAEQIRLLAAEVANLKNADAGLQQDKTSADASTQAPAAKTAVQDMGLDGFLKDDFTLTDELADEIADDSVVKVLNKVFNVIKQREDQAQERLKPLADLQKTAERDQKISEDVAKYTMLKDSLLDLSTQHPEVYGSNSKELVEALDDFWKTGTLSEVLKPFDATLEHMNNGDLPNVMTAHRDLHWASHVKSADKKAVDAAKEAVKHDRKQSELTGKRASMSLGADDTETSQGGDEFSKQQIDDILKNKAPMPENWYNKDGTPNFDKMPASAQKVVQNAGRH